MPTLPDVAVSTTPGEAVRIVLPAVAAGATLIGFGQPVSGELALNADRSLTYVPSPGFTGADEFAYTVRDGAGGASSDGRVAIAVAPANREPAATGDVVSTRAGKGVAIPVLANDNDPDADPLSLVAFSTPAFGDVRIGPGQEVHYEPQAGFVGTDSFTYTIGDGRGGTSTAGVSVAVAGLDGPPVARDDKAQTDIGKAVTVAVLANDRDPDGDPLSLLSVSLPDNGSLAANPDQTLTYTPLPGFFGQDEFTYAVGDGRDGSAEAKVTVDVRRPNQRPVVRGEQATTEAGKPVTVAVLANDNDPDGDSLTLVALGMPANGALAVNADQTLTYTPHAGYVGPDEFTYTVTDGWGVRITGRVAVAVNPGRPQNYPNGYVNRRLIVVPADAAKGRHAGFPLWLKLSGAWLKPKATGGRLEGAAPLDVRFELEDGTKLPHEVAAHDAEAGRLQAWVRLPLLADNADARLFIYYGKPGGAPAGGEEDAAAVWADYLAVWHLPGGGDRGPFGRDLSTAGTVAEAATEGLAGALALDGAGTLARQDAATWLGGLDALTLQVRAKATATGHERGLVNCGAFGGDAPSALTLRYAGVKGALFAKLKTTAGDATLTTKAGLQGTGWQSLALAWSAGDARLGLFVDGAAAEAALAGEVGPAAKTAVSGSLLLGAGAKDSAAGGWQGLIDEVRVRAGKLAKDWLAAEHANQSSPDTFYGLGSEDTADDVNVSAVAVPVIAATRANSWVDLDVLPRAFNPDSLRPLAISAVTQPANGIASIIEGKVRYTPRIGFFGEDGFSYTITRGAKRSTARVKVRVEKLNVDLPTPKRTVTVSNATQLAKALGEAQPGDHILLADAAYGGGFTVRRAGTASDPVLIRALNPLGARFSGGSIGIDADRVWIWGLLLDGTTVSIKGDGARMTRCKQQDTPNTVAVSVSRGRGVSIDYNEFARMRGRGISVVADPANPGLVQDVHIHHNHLRNWVGNPGENVHEGIQSGLTRSHSDVKLRTIIEWNLIEEVGIDSEAVSIKSSENIVRFNTLWKSAAGLVNRHGEGNQFIGNWLEDSRGMTLLDRAGKAIGNKFVGDLTGLRLLAGELTASDWDAGKEGIYPAAEGWLVAGNEGQVTVGFAFAGSRIPAKGTRIEANKGAVSLKTETATSTSPTTSVQVPVARRLTASDVGPNAA